MNALDFLSTVEQKKKKRDKLMQISIWNIFKYLIVYFISYINFR